jgi:hypothetical protein
MARIVQHRRGTTAEVAGITGAAGELFVDTSKVTVVVMDGILQGGVPLATETSVTQLSSTVVGVIANVSSLSSNLASVSSTVGTQTSQISSLSSNLATVSSTVGTQTSQISSLSSNLATVSSAVANISVPTGTTTTLGIVRPDNSSINISATGVLSLGSSVSTNWTFAEVGGSLVFYYAGTAKLKFNSDGSIVAVDNITAYGTV